MPNRKVSFNKIRTIDKDEYEHQTYNYLNSFETGIVNSYTVDDIKTIFVYDNDANNLLSNVNTPVHLHDNRWYKLTPRFKSKKFFYIRMGRIKNDVS